MIKAAENGIDPDDLFPPLRKPALNANTLVNWVPVPRRLLQRYNRRRSTYSPPLPPFPNPDPKTMYNSFLPLTMEYVARPPQKTVEEAWEEDSIEEGHEEEPDDDDDFFLKDE